MHIAVTLEPPRGSALAHASVTLTDDAGDTVELHELRILDNGEGEFVVLPRMHLGGNLVRPVALSNGLWARVRSAVRDAWRASVAP